jgi:hypothetical protein
MFYYCFFLVSLTERFIGREDFTGQVLAYRFGRLYEKRPFFAGMKHGQADFTLSQRKLCLCALPRHTCANDQMLHALSSR